MKPTILDTPYAKALGMPLLGKSAARFLQQNVSSLDMDQEGYAGLLAEARQMTTSYQNTLFQHLVSADKLSSMFFYSFMSSPKDLPELLTYEDIAIDGKYLKQTLTKDLEKVWVNLTPSLKRGVRRGLGGLQIADIPKMISAVTRAFLCASYNDSREWLPPAVSTFLVEVYTIAMASVMERLFSLNSEEATVPKIMFAWYYASLIAPSKNDAEIPPIAMKAKSVFGNIGSASDLKQLIDRANEIRDGRTMSLELAVELITKLGPARTKNLKSNDLRRIFALSAQSNTALMIAIDYPPYLLHQILAVEDGAKHGILSYVLKQRFRRPYVKKALDQVVSNKKLLDEGTKR